MPPRLYPHEKQSDVHQNMRRAPVQANLGRPFANNRDANLMCPQESIQKRHFVLRRLYSS